ncbi:RiPP maturation radical SAM C-methyltransferase [Archangium violaceum]|uniref:Radical SAM core domain-containing protein n=1 Tax=Archangium violaceum Cb vi76 TaxID=1406225 RepID=A0A084SNW3_9BACT|nr:RiPP maturation radical SAM C-methyltransferase [Archangium violaceum]KFA90148.1 hypothetical protein Q664_29680 [Archangium violaceum Cb vi76]
MPDYEDFFSQHENTGLQEETRLPFESSRGCWWGQKHLCSFCGLNGTNLSYRTKSPERVIAELRSQFLRHGVRQFSAADNILDMAYLKTFLPGLKRLHEELGIELFYETKSNLRGDQVRALAEAGVTAVQPGIESFSDHILKRMDKGTTGLNQVRFLRDCTSNGVEPHYGILWGNPGETREDYERMTALVPLIQHLPPPKYVVPVVLQRFSPYFLSPGKYGIRNVRPAPIYEAIFAGCPIDTTDIAYFFQYEHDFDQDAGLRRAINDFIQATYEWKKTYRPFSLLSCVMDGILYVCDGRNGAPRMLRLAGPEMAVFQFCEVPRPEGSLREAFPDLPEPRLRALLEHLVSRGLLLHWVDERSGKYVSLPIQVSTEVFYEHGLKPLLELDDEEARELA